MRMRCFGKAIAVVGCLILVVSLVAYANDQTGPSGKNEAIHLYINQPGFPPYDPRGIDLGILRGSWFEIGVQHAQGTGELIQVYFDWRFGETVKRLGDVQHVVDDINRYEVEIERFSPQAVEFMKGIAHGAAPYFRKSKYADALTDYEKAVFMACEFCIVYGHPCEKEHWPLPGKVAMNEQFSMEPMEEEQETSCTAMVVLGSETKDNNTLFCHVNNETFIRCHRMNYLVIPDDPLAIPFWASAEPGKLISLGSANSAGVANVILAGPGRTCVPDEGIHERSFGVPWPVVSFMISAYANNLQEAVDMITIGTSEYREKTGRSTLLRARQNSWVLADNKQAAVVEATAHRYAVRYPGDNGEDGYIVAANHFVSNFSCDEENRHTSFPMTKFGDEVAQGGSALRYYTFYWLTKLNKGSIDVDMIKEFAESHFYITKEGVRVDYVWNAEHGWLPSYLGSRTVCTHQGYPEAYKGNTVNTTIADLTNLNVHWSLGRPCEWIGPWKFYTIPQ